jgi:hypothetical protein
MAATSQATTMVTDTVQATVAASADEESRDRGARSLTCALAERFFGLFFPIFAA